MKSFGILLGLAFLGLALAGILAGRGERGLALVFMLLAILTAAFALFSKPQLRRDPRGRLEEVDPPFARFLGVVGALAMLGAAGYVALSTGRPLTPEPVRPVRSTPLVAPSYRNEPRVQVGRPVQGNWLHKCVEASGHTSFQSAPCPEGSQQVWRRAAVPEQEPVRSRNNLASAPRRSSASNVSIISQQRVRPEDSSACRAARAADHNYRNQPLKYVKHDGLRRHGDAVRRACG